MIFSKEQLDALDSDKIPEHVAIMMDGNRRWAKSCKLKYVSGHKKGADNLTRITKASVELGIKTLTVYAFSTENWDRSKKEIDALMNLFKTYLIKHAKTLKKERIRLKTIGDISKCPLSLQHLLNETMEKTVDGDKLNLVVAINYGGRDEITRAVKKILIDYDKKKITNVDISEDLVSSYLDTAFCSDPDLLIRTSGESRLSNFLLWQMSYAEFFVVDVLWPDFLEKHLYEAVLEFQKRERRFGKK